MPPLSTDTRIDEDDRAELLEIAERLAQPDGPLLDRRDDEVVEEIAAMASVVDV